jgi:hypothetical protein
MQYVGTAFSVTLGAWRLRFSLSLEDAPNECAARSRTAPAQLRQPSDSATSR